MSAELSTRQGKALLGGFIGGTIRVGINAIGSVCALWSQGRKSSRAVEEVSVSTTRYESEGRLSLPPDDGNASGQLLAPVLTLLAQKMRYATQNIEDIRENDYIASRDQNDPDAPLVYEGAGIAFTSDALDDLRALTIS